MPGLMNALKTQPVESSRSVCEVCAGDGCLFCNGERVKLTEQLQREIDCIQREGQKVSVATKRQIARAIDRLNPAPSQPVETSEAAATKIKGKVRYDRKRVFNLIKSFGTIGATDDHIQYALGMNGNTQRPRRLELEAAGLIKRLRNDKGKLEKRRTRSGGDGMVFVAIPGKDPKPWTE